MAVTEQIVVQSKSHTQTLTALSHSIGVLKDIAHPLSGQSIAELATVAAQNTVDGFIAQDRLDFDGSVLHWSQVFHTMHPDLDSERVVKAAEAFVSALFAQSRLKDHTSDPYERIHSDTWEYVRSELVRMCGLLDLPSSFGIETSDAYRYHSVKDDSYMKHIIECHRVLMKSLTGDERAYRELAGLYVSAISFHDQHTHYGVKKGREIMNLYYTILFEAKYSNLLVKN